MTEQDQEAAELLKRVKAAEANIVEKYGEKFRPYFAKLSAAIPKPGEAAPAVGKVKFSTYANVKVVKRADGTVTTYRENEITFPKNKAAYRRRMIVVEIINDLLAARLVSSSAADDIARIVANDPPARKLKRGSHVFGKRIKPELREVYAGVAGDRMEHALVCQLLLIQHRKPEVLDLGTEQVDRLAAMRKRFLVDLKDKIWLMDAIAASKAADRAAAAKKAAEASGNGA